MKNKEMILKEISEWLKDYELATGQAFGDEDTLKFMG